MRSLTWHPRRHSKRAPHQRATLADCWLSTAVDGCRPLDDSEGIWVRGVTVPATPLSTKENRVNSVPDSTRIGSPMARWLRSAIARAESQFVPRMSGGARSTRIRQNRREDEAFCAARIPFDDKPVTRQGLSAHDFPQVVREVLERREAARFAVKVREIETPTAGLVSAVLAHHAVEPALEPASQAEICPVDSEDERVIQNARIEPIRQYQFKAQVVDRACRPSPSTR